MIETDDICLYSTWFIAGIESYYLGNFQKAFASDIYDVNDDYIKNILRLADKCNEKYSVSITDAIRYLKTKHPLIEKKPLGKVIKHSEFKIILI